MNKETYFVLNRFDLHLCNPADDEVTVASRARQIFAKFRCFHSRLLSVGAQKRNENKKREAEDERSETRTISMHTRSFVRFVLRQWPCGIGINTYEIIMHAGGVERPDQPAPADTPIERALACVIYTKCMCKEPRERTKPSGRPRVGYS